MLINIASLRQPTFKSQFSKQRPSYLSINDYLTSELDARVDHVRWKIKVAAKAARERHAGAACLFFTLPEFFWNIPWHVVQSEEELHELNSAYLEKLSAAVMTLMEDLPVKHYGKIVLLGGSCASLIKIEQSDSNHYEAINYLLVISNKEYEVDKPLISMWPKRYVSGIDFGRHVGTSAGYWYFNLFGDFVVKVKALSSVQAEHSYFDSYEGRFLNNLVPGCPFGVNLCLDYSLLKEGERDEEIELKNSKIDFLIACGMGLDYSKRHLPSIQYSVRNDGFDDGECEVVRHDAGKIVGVVPSVVIDCDVHLASLRIT
ncbi:hypothetical protein [Pseudomonas sp. Root562]|uniref:hypothetical protein n=1 Tax=Pseudomonas sp. Root562 TaxID=1736561 RepID=UPI0007038422|nr:hypothetical protein [Pseudomonas sp. Root562]KQZ92509.1 hypothetical protein ASD60_23055 [Pseudomonas sp. Root562]